MAAGAAVLSVAATPAGPSRHSRPWARRHPVGVPSPRLKAHPPEETLSTTARFGFVGPAGARFRCRLDHGEVTSCHSPRVYRKVRRGGHSFRVYAIAANGERSKATVFTWKVVS